MAPQCLAASRAAPAAHAALAAPGNAASTPPPVARAAVMWARPPELLARAQRRLAADLTESRLEFDPATRRAMGQWLLHMIALGFITEAEVARAMSHRTPFTSLERLYVQSCARLAKHLNQLVSHHAGGYGETLRPAFEIKLAQPREGSSPAITFALSGYYPFEVTTLHQVPEPLAAAVYECVNLISDCLVNCLLPDEMWTAEFQGLHEDFKAEYETLRAGADTNDLEALAARVAAGQFDYFTTDPYELRGQIEFARQMFEERPRWMACRIGKPITHARALKRRMATETRVQGAHPWRTYIEIVCSTLCKRFASDRALSRHKARIKHARLPWEDTEVPLSMALWVDSGAACEHQNVEYLYDGMGQNGEEPVEQYDLARLASANLRDILEGIAIGIGLLLRAEAVNDEVKRGG